jgi:hypothetical protein
VAAIPRRRLATVLKVRITDPATIWRRAVQASRTSWRSGGWIEYTCGTPLWYHGGKEPLPIHTSGPNF